MMSSVSSELVFVLEVPLTLALALAEAALLDDVALVVELAEEEVFDGEMTAYEESQEM